MTTKMKAMTTKKKKEEEEEEESDEDEISDIGKSTPLKLNTQNESVPPQQSNYNPVNITDLGSIPPITLLINRVMKIQKGLARLSQSNIQIFYKA